MPALGRMLRQRRGASSLGNLGISIGIVVVITALYVFVPPYFNNWKLGTMLRSVAEKSAGLESAEAVTLYAIEELKQQNYYFRPENMKVKKEGRFVDIAVHYKVDAFIPFTDFGLTIAFEREGSNRGFNN